MVALPCLPRALALLAMLSLGTLHPWASAGAARKSGRAEGIPIRRVRAGRSPVPAVIVDGDRVATLVRPKGSTPTQPPDRAPRVVWDPTGFPKYEPEPTLDDAIELLVQSVEKMTGRRLPVVEEGVPVQGPQVHLGRTQLAMDTLGPELARLDPEGYIHFSTPKALLVVGGDRYGQAFAVAALLEQQGGVRWLFPGPLGEAVPERERWVIADANRIDEPAFRAREIEGISNWNVIPWETITQTQQWLHRNGMRSGRYPYIHNLGHLIEPKQYGKAHPEWYALVDGKRQNDLYEATHNLQPCVAAPGLAEHVANQVVAYFDEHPEAQCYSLANVDGSGFCQCDGCRALDGEYANRAWGSYVGRVTNRMYRFFNRVADLVARKHPDKILGTLAYSEYLYPPSFDLHPMLMPYVCSTRDGYCNPRFKSEDQWILEQWSKRARQVGVYQYFHGAGYLVPRIYPHLLNDALCHAYEHGARGFTAEAFPNWGLDAPKLYCLAKGLWNPYTDVDKALDDFCTSAFGSAAPAMRRVFDLAEQTWTRLESFENTHWFNIEADLLKQLRRYPPDVVREINIALTAARAKAGDQGLARQRVEFFARPIEMLNLLEPGYRAAGLAERGAPLREVLLALRDPEPIAGRLQKYWKENEFGPLHLYPGTYVDVAGKQGWGWSCIQPLEGEEGSLDAVVAASLGRRLGAEVLASLEMARPAGPRAFRDAFRAALDSECTRQLADLPVGSKAEHMAREVRASASKVAVAFPVRAPATIDGNLDEPFWAEALANRDFLTYATGAPAVTRTEFVAAYDAANFYLGIRCPQDRAEMEKVPAVDGRQSTAVWSDHSVEVFVNRREAGTPYHQIAVSRGGGWYLVHSGGPSADGAGPQCATQTGDGGWRVEMKIPWKWLGILPGREREALLNVVRNRLRPQPDGPPKLEMTTWCLSRGAHAEPGNRGLLVLRGAPDPGAAPSPAAAAAPASLWGSLIANAGFEEHLPTDVSAANAAFAPLFERKVQMPAGAQVPMPRHVSLNPADGWPDAACGFEYFEGEPGKEVHAGRRAIRILSPAHYSAVVIGRALPVGRGLSLSDSALVVGASHSLSFYAKGEGSVAATVYLYDEKTAGLYSLDRTRCVSPPAIDLPREAAQEWQRCEVAVQIPYPEVHSVQLVLRVRGNVTLDDVCLKVP